MEKDSTKLIVLKGVNIIFSELEDNGYGRSLTIDATDPAIQKEITAWVKTNGLTGGEPKFKEYAGKDKKTTIQFTFKISDYTKFGGKEGLGESDLGYGATINLQARAFNYKNKFGEGISASLDAVYVLTPAKNNALDNIAE